MIRANLPADCLPAGEFSPRPKRLQDLRVEQHAASDQIIASALVVEVVGF